MWSTASTQIIVLRVGVPTCMTNCIDQQHCVADIRGGRDKDDNSSVRLDHL